MDNIWIIGTKSSYFCAPPLQGAGLEARDYVNHVTTIQQNRNKSSMLPAPHQVSPLHLEHRAMLLWNDAQGVTYDALGY